MLHYMYHFSHLLYISDTCLSWLETPLLVCISSVRAQPAFSAADNAAETFSGIELDAVITCKTERIPHKCTFRRINIVNVSALI